MMPPQQQPMMPPQQQPMIPPQQMGGNKKNKYVFYDNNTKTKIKNDFFF